MFDFLLLKRAKIQNLSFQFATKDGFCFRGHFKAIIDTVSDHPKNVAVSGNQQPNIPFLPFRKLLIPKEIAQQFGAFHAQRMEAIAMMPMA